MAGGRPTDYSPAVVEQAKDYLDHFLDEDRTGDLRPRQVVPTVVGLCTFINRGSTTVYNWEKDADKTEFRDILSQIKEVQHHMTLNGGMMGHYNSVIAKMLLTKHGYSDKIEQAHTSPDGSMSPTRIEIVAPGDNG